jgi:uncharacterized repeat protein (TIGR03803 family)
VKTQGGTVFKVDTTGKETLLHSFPDGRGDGVRPHGELAMDAQGNLYGTTAAGGDGRFSFGTVFKIDSGGNETVLHDFCPAQGCVDGAFPYGGLVIDAQGNLYGTAFAGGATNNGTVFKVDTAGNQTVLYNFCPSPGCAGGANPRAALVIDAQGNLYGTTFFGGAKNSGAVFKLDKAGNETVLYSFTGIKGDALPFAGLVRDAQGNLYGTTTGGRGIVFKVDTSGNETMLHTFFARAGGLTPFGGLVMDAQGNLYGTTYGGGARNSGTVFKLTP